MQNPLFALGASYYPDYIASPRLSTKWRDEIATDFQRMVRAGIHVIRMGEFSWSHVEPEPGMLVTERFELALDLAAEKGIEVIFCTPTATPPKWVIDKYPDILPVTRDGRVIPFGTRRHYDVCNSNYWREATRITEAYGAAFGHHRAIVGWQIDNEFGCHGSLYSFTAAARLKFQTWLSLRYGQDIEKLNEQWFTSFWSQCYTSFEQIELPLQSWTDQNPHLELDFRRFCNDQYKQFTEMQSAILETTSPGRYVTHNFMSQFSDLCPWTLSDALDIAGFDHYQMNVEPDAVASHWQFALMHSLKQRRFLVLEQQPLQVNWQSVNRRFSYDWLFLWTVQAAFLGASGMLYFSWKRFLGGPEQYHDAIVPHDARIEQSWQERVIAATNEFFAHLQTDFALAKMPEPAADVVCIHNYESFWTHEIASQSSEYSTFEQLSFVAKFCHQQRLGLAFAPSVEEAERRGLLVSAQIVFVPGYAFELTEAERALLSDLAMRGTSIVSFPRSFMKHKNNQMSERPLQIAGFDELVLEDFGALLPDEREHVRTAKLEGGIEFLCHSWAERIDVRDQRWQSQATFHGGLYDGWPAVLQRKDLSQGSFIHFSACPSDDSTVISWLAELCNLKPILAAAHQVQTFTLHADGRTFSAIINFSVEPAVVHFDNPPHAMMSARLSSDQHLLYEQSDQISVGGRAEIKARSILFAQIGP